MRDLMARSTILELKMVKGSSSGWGHIPGCDLGVDGDLWWVWRSPALRKPRSCLAWMDELHLESQNQTLWLVDCIRWGGLGIVNIWPKKSTCPVWRGQQSPTAARPHKVGCRSAVTASLKLLFPLWKSRFTEQLKNALVVKCVVWIWLCGLPVWVLGSTNTLVFLGQCQEVGWEVIVNWIPESW